VCLQSLTDHRGGAIPTGGVLREDMAPKPALASLAELRQRLHASPTK
jgi:hypothetical protein